MKSPIKEFRKEIEKDIEKYSSLDEPILKQLLNEYIELIDEIYIREEQKTMLTYFVKGLHFKN